MRFPRFASSWLSVVVALALGACRESVDPSAWPPFTVRGAWVDASALRYRVAEPAGPMPAQEFRLLIQRATDVWSAAGNVGFVPVEVGGPCDVVIGWGQAASDEDPDAPFGRDSGIAITGPVGDGCFIQFDASREWLEVDGRGPSLYQAAVHELGHVVGLGHVEQIGSVMHSQWQGGVAELSAGDLAGVHTLYGGGVASEGDLVVESGETVRVLQGVAPAKVTEWATLDTDGDGDDELLVWATGSVGHGALMIYHFSAGLRLERTVGPILGVVGPRMAAAPGADVAGRFLAVRDPAGMCWRRPFDDRGWLLPKYGEVTWPAADGPVPTDLDGDGMADGIRHR